MLAPSAASAASPGEVSPSSASPTRSHAASWLSNAFLLNAPRGSALDWLGGGSDPIYVSGARIAPQKLMMLLAYFDAKTSSFDLDLVPNMEVQPGVIELRRSHSGFTTTYTKISHGATSRAQPDAASTAAATYV